MSLITFEIQREKYIAAKIRKGILSRKTERKSDQHKWEKLTNLHDWSFALFQREN